MYPGTWYLVSKPADFLVFFFAYSPRCSCGNPSTLLHVFSPAAVFGSLLTRYCRSLLLSLLLLLLFFFFSFFFFFVVRSLCFFVRSLCCVFTQATDEEPVPLCPLLWPIARQVRIKAPWVGSENKKNET